MAQSWTFRQRKSSKAASRRPALGSASDTDAQFGLAIARAAFDPTGPVGLADTIKQCALDAPYPICDGLEALTGHARPVSRFGAKDLS